MLLAVKLAAITYCPVIDHAIRNIKWKIRYLQLGSLVITHIHNRQEKFTLKSVPRLGTSPALRTWSAPVQWAAGRGTGRESGHTSGWVSLAASLARFTSDRPVFCENSPVRPTLHSAAADTIRRPAALETHSCGEFTSTRFVFVIKKKYLRVVRAQN